MITLRATVEHILPRHRLSAGLALLAGLLLAAPAAPQDAVNLTRMPTYPNLIQADMDQVTTVETLGHQCARLVATTHDSLFAVEVWYRRVLKDASETDLLRDELFAHYGIVSGIKLAVGLDYAAIFQVPGRPTVIELHRCNWLE